MPAACVVEHSGRSGGVVFVVRDGIARRTEVKLGGDNGSLRRDPLRNQAGRSPSCSPPERRWKTGCASPPRTGACILSRTRRVDPRMISHPRLRMLCRGKARPMNGLIRASLKNPIAVTVMVLSLVVLGGLAAYSIPDRHPAGLQEPGGADAGLLQRDAGRQHRKEHHRSARARGGPGVGGPAARVAVDRRHQHRPRLLPQQRRPQRCA